MVMPQKLNVLAHNDSCYFYSQIICQMEFNNPNQPEGGQEYIPTCDWKVRDQKFVVDITEDNHILPIWSQILGSFFPTSYIYIYIFFSLSPWEKIEKFYPVITSSRFLSSLHDSLWFLNCGVEGEPQKSLIHSNSEILPGRICKGLLSWRCGLFFALVLILVPRKGSLVHSSLGPQFYPV